MVVMLEPLVKAQTKSVRSEILASSFLVESMDSYRSSFMSSGECPPPDSDPFSKSGVCKKSRLLVKHKTRSQKSVLETPSTCSSANKEMLTGHKDADSIAL